MENRTVQLDASDPNTLVTAIICLSDRINELTGQLGSIMAVLGVALGSDIVPHGVKLALLTGAQGARTVGWESPLLSIFERMLTIGGPIDPKGGTHLKLVGGTEGPEAKAA